MTELSDGTISVVVTHTGLKDGGVLDVHIKDTGKGFDTNKLEQYLTNNSEYHSRGILMVNSICKSLNYNKCGNEVHAQYEWQTKPSH